MLLFLPCFSDPLSLSLDNAQTYFVYLHLCTKEFCFPPKEILSLGSPATLLFTFETTHIQGGRASLSSRNKYSRVLTKC